MAYDYNLAPKDLDAQCAAFKKKYPSFDALPADEYIMMAKYDGCLAIIVSDHSASASVISRTGEPITSMPHCAKAAAELLPGWVIFGEAYKFDTPFKDISGAFRRHAPQDSLICVAFDAVPVADWRAGKCDIPYKDRLARLKAAWQATPQSAIIVAPALDYGAPQGFANALVKSGGYDGAIVRRADAPWMAGASKNGEAIKVKPVQSLDLRAVDWFYGKGKHAGRAGGIVVEYRGVTTQVGTGFSDAERETIAKQGTRDWIAEVEFMELTEDGKLREPRFKGWRFDKDEPDA
jgi:ATP-dependent DNA ligase